MSSMFSRWYLNHVLTHTCNAIHMQNDSAYVMPTGQHCLLPDGGGTAIAALSNFELKTIVEI